VIRAAKDAQGPLQGHSRRLGGDRRWQPSWQTPPTWRRGVCQVAEKPACRWAHVTDLSRAATARKSFTGCPWCARASPACWPAGKLRAPTHSAAHFAGQCNGRHCVHPYWIVHRWRAVSVRSRHARQAVLLQRACQKMSFLSNLFKGIKRPWQVSSARCTRNLAGRSCRLCDERQSRACCCSTPCLLSSSHCCCHARRSRVSLRLPTTWSTCPLPWSIASTLQGANAHPHAATVIATAAAAIAATCALQHLFSHACHYN
jgi:hypothetical protein